MALLSGVFDFAPCTTCHSVRHGNLGLTARALVHDVEPYGLRAEREGQVFAYSGDNGPCDGLGQLRRAGADLFLCEADVGTHREGEPRAHPTPEADGTSAKSASRLLITYVGPTLTREGETGRAAVVLRGPAPERARGRHEDVQDRVTAATSSFVRSIDETRSPSYLQPVVLRTSYMRRDT